MKLHTKNKDMYFVPILIYNLFAGQSEIPPLFFSFLVSWGGVRLRPLGTSDTNWPIVPAPDDR
jgi:hypothetical protein